MVGMEGAAPSSSKHSKTGAVDPMTATGGSYYDDLAPKLAIAGEDEYRDTKLPKKYGGMFIKLSKEQITAFRDLQLNEIDYKVLAHSTPYKSLDDLKDACLHNKKHSISSHKPPKEDETLQSQKPVATWKKVLNLISKILSLGIVNPYEKEIAAFSKTTKIAESQNKVKEGYKKNNPDMHHASAQKGKHNSVIGSHREKLAKTQTNNSRPR